MARRRMIDWKFWADKKFFLRILRACELICHFKTRSSLFRFARDVRLFFIGSWNFADDEGRFISDLVQLKGEVVPFDEDFTLKKIEKVLQVLKKAKRVFIYEVAGVEYGYIVNFKKHQTINRPTPSILPPPPEDKFNEWLTEDIVSDSGVTQSQVKLSKVKLSKVNKESNPPSAASHFPPVEKSNTKPEKDWKKIQDRQIEKTQKLWVGIFDQKIVPSQLQLLVHGSKKHKIHGFKSYEALWIWMGDCKLRGKPGQKPDGDAFLYAKALAKDWGGVKGYSQRAWGSMKDAQVIADVFDEIKMKFGKKELPKAEEEK